MQILDGKEIAAQIKEEIKKEVAGYIDQNLGAPHLAAILVGNDPASESYVNNKEKDCKAVGIISSVYKLSEKISEHELLKTIDFLNNDREIDGFIVQLPLPPGINTEKVISAIDPQKDIDGFHPVNLGKMITGEDGFLPATPYGIVELIRRTGIETAGKHCVVIGRSNIVGTPISILLSRKSYPGNCTVTLCHSMTRNLPEITTTADILIAAAGQPEMVTSDMVKKGAVVIDVGIHQIPDQSAPSGFRWAGDVKYGEVAPKCSYITPVPGGVGPMTRVALLMNTLKAFRKKHHL